MEFYEITLKTEYSQSEYPDKQKDIENINKILETYGLKVDKVKERAQVIRYIIHVPLDIKRQGWVKCAWEDIINNIIATLGTDNIVILEKENDLIIERRGMFNVIPFGALYTSYFDDVTPISSAVLGLNKKEDTVYFDIGKTSNVLIAGSNESDKTETMNSIIASLLMHNIYSAPPGLKTIIDIIDMNGKYSKYNDASIKIIDDEYDAFFYLDQLCVEMEARCSAFEKHGCTHIDEYIQKGFKMARRICIIDEFADLVLKIRRIEDYVVRLSQKARACGIHLVIGTQHISRDVVTESIKTNFSFKIALHTSTEKESCMLIDKSGAERLWGRGEMLIKDCGESPIRVHGCHVFDEDITNMVKLADETIVRKVRIKSESPEVAVNTSNIKREFATRYVVSKKVGFFQGIRNIMNAPQCTTPSDFMFFILDD